MLCFSCILISNVHKSVIVMNSVDTRFSRNVFFKPFKKLAAPVLSGLKPIKHSCSFLKHYLSVHKGMCYLLESRFIEGSSSFKFSV